VYVVHRSITVVEEDKRSIQNNSFCEGLNSNIDLEALLSRSIMCFFPYHLCLYILVLKVLTNVDLNMMFIANKEDAAYIYLSLGHNLKRLCECLNCRT